MNFLIQVVLLLLPTYILTYLLFSIFALLKRIQQARRIGLPYVFYPADQSNPWLRVLLSLKFFQIIVNRWLPDSLADRINDNCYEYRWTVKDREIRRLGRCYLRATPGGLVCEITDAETAAYVFNARNEYPKAYVQYGRSIQSSQPRFLAAFLDRCRCPSKVLICHSRKRCT